MIYLDYNATTPVLQPVIDAMLPFLQHEHGNPSSGHAIGRRAKEAVDQARARLAELIGARPSEIFFTSGGTESNNLALIGTARAAKDRDRIIASAVEHPAVLEVCHALAGARGVRLCGDKLFSLTMLDVDDDGRVDPARLEATINRRTSVISIMHANNEVGTIQPIAELAAIAHRHGAIVHCDAAQSIGKLRVNVDELGVDLLSIAGHKLYAPKGIGALYVRSGIELVPLMYGAGQERRLRPGTENVMHIVGLGAAATLFADLESEASRLRDLRDRLHALLSTRLGAAALRLNGHPEKRLPNTLSLGFLGCRADRLVASLDGEVAVSAGAACHAGGDAISSVLQAMRVPADAARGTLRLSLGHLSSADEIDTAAATIAKAVIAERSA